MFSLQRKCLICSSALYQSFHIKDKLSVGSSGLCNRVSVQCHPALTAATVGSLEKSTGTLSNILKILVEHYFKNYQLAHLPSASPCMCSLPPGLGWGVELLELLEKEEARDEPLLSSNRKGRFIAKWAAEHRKIWYAKGAKHNSSSDALLCDGYKAKEEVMKVYTTWSGQCPFNSCYPWQTLPAHCSASRSLQGYLSFSFCHKTCRLGKGNFSDV